MATLFSNFINIIALIIWGWLTFKVYCSLAKKYNIVSFSGFIGHMWGHLDLLISSILIAGLIMGIPLYIGESLLKWIGIL